MGVKFVMAIGSLLGTSLIGVGLSATALQKDESKRAPFYAGFKEIDPKKNHFIIVGDTQRTSLLEFWRERNDKERKLIIDGITRREPAFVLHLGDLTTRGGSEKNWQEFDDLHKELRERRIPYFPILGNHEFYGSDDEALRNYFSRFPGLEGKRWYSFIWKRIAFLMVDSIFPTLTMEQIEEQGNWYFRELERFERDEGVACIIVCCHEPPFTNSRVVSPNKKSKTFFADPYVQFRKTCFFFSGHGHTYERFQVDGKHFIVSGGGGGPRHIVTVDPATRRYRDLFPGPEIRFFHACEIEVGEQGLMYRVLRLESDGTFSIVDLMSKSWTW
jgi:3',5'-cyclic AMP phosphodiesterase CpdA